jgi:cell division septal protein FtsQ
MERDKKSGDVVSGQQQREDAPSNQSKKVWIILGVIVLLLLIGVVVVNSQFDMETIQVSGNVHYTDEQMIQMVVGDEYHQNTLILYLKNKLHPAEDIPFVEKVDVEYISRHVITITVYEKAMAGCVQFMNEYMYFDKDGIVLESSSERLEDIPCIEGIHFDTMVLYEPLPIEDETFFNTVLNLTQLLKKYELQIDDVRFTNNNEIILYHDDIKIMLGDSSNMEDQISELGSILESIKGKSGTLYMKDYSIENSSVIFRENQ